MSWWPSIQRRRIGIRRRSCQIECSQIVLKCLYLTRIESPDIPWTVNKLARAITKRVRACDNRLIRLISCIHFTSEYNQYCHVWNTAQKIRLWLFQDFDTAGNPEDSKSTSGGTLCVFGSRTFVPISWMWKKQTCVSHSSTDSEIISLNTGLRMDGIPVLDPWDLDITVIHSNSNQEQKDKQARRNPLHDKASGSDDQYISSDAHNTHIFLVSTSHDSSHKACAQNSHSWSAFSCHSLVLMRRAFSSFCFTSPSSLFSFSFVVVSGRIPTVARVRGESDCPTGSQTQIISPTLVSFTRRIPKRSSTRWTITRKEHHWVFQSRSRIKKPEPAVVSQQLARYRRCLVPTERAFDNEGETMFLNEVCFLIQ